MQWIVVLVIIAVLFVYAGALVAVPLGIATLAVGKVLEVLQ